MSPVRLNGSTSGYTELSAPAAAGSNTLTLPTGNGSAHQILKNGATAGSLEYGPAFPSGNGTNGQYLQTNGSGTLSWSTVTSGKILQVVSTTKTDTFSTTSATLTDITGLSVAITPSSTSNKILITGTICWSISDTIPYLGYFVLFAGSNPICRADAAGNRTRATIGAQGVYSTDHTLFAPLNFLDSPSSVAAITYKLQGAAEGGRTLYVNRAGESDGDQSITARFVSTITAMEVAA